MYLFQDSVLISICARGGSKGIPRKNIRNLNGKPLIAYTIDFAQKAMRIFPNAVIELSTDDDEIIKVAGDFGLFTSYKRPALMAQDHSGKVGVIRELWKYAQKHNQKTFDYVLDLDVSSPLRTLEDIGKAFELMKSNHQALTLYSVHLSHKNPYFNMVEKMENGFYGISKKFEKGVLSRQTAPPVYDINGAFYYYTNAFLQSEMEGVITNRSLIYEMKHECFDLDNLIDFEFMNYLLSEGKLSFDI